MALQCPKTGLVKGALQRSVIAAIVLGSAFVLAGCNGPAGAPGSTDLAGKQTASNEPTQCLDPRGRQVWHNRYLAKNLSENELASRAGQGVANELTLPITGRLDIMKSAAQNFGAVLGAAKPVCGNWCGAARYYSADDFATVDELDQACKRHALCSRARGGTNCSCDQQLADEILRERNALLLSEHEKSMISYLRGSACKGGCKRIEGIQVCGS